MSESKKSNVTVTKINFFNFLVNFWVIWGLPKVTQKVTQKLPKMYPLGWVNTKKNYLKKNKKNPKKWVIFVTVTLLFLDSDTLSHFT